MTKIEHILVATDGSDLSKKAAALAGVLARACGARVSIAMVHDEQIVIPDAWEGVGLQLSHEATAVSTEDVRHRIEAHARSKDLAQTAEAVGALESPPQLTNLWGQPVDQLCDYASENDVDMILIGSHGRTGIKRAILGSVSNAVANSAPCAVTIVR